MNITVKSPLRNQPILYYVKIVLFGLLILNICSISINAGPNPARLNLAHGVQQEHPTNIVALEVQKEIAIRTGNRIKLEIFSNMQFGEEAELCEMLRNGKLDLAIISTGPLAVYNPDLAILDLPYLFNERDQAYQAWDGEPGAAILKGFQNSGLEGICYWENGLRSLTTKNTPVNTLDDLENIHLRTMENQIYIDFFSYLGALPTPMPWGQVTPSLRAGIIEAQENPIPIIVTNELEKYQKYLILTKHVYNPHLVLFGPSLRSKLSDNEMALIRQLFYDFRIKQRRYVVENETNGIKILQEKGMTVLEPDLAEFQRLGKEFSKSALTRFSKEICGYFERYLKQ
jgi:tripartite ATP-independent transporter DctP family solute receptor